MDRDNHHAGERSRNVLYVILERARRESGAEEGGILVRDETTGQLRIEVSIGPGVTDRKRIISSDPTKSLCAASVQQRKEIYVPDVPNSDRPFHQLSDTPILSAFVIPVVVEERCIGVVNLESHRKDAFTEKQRNLTIQLISSLSQEFQVAGLELERLFLRRQISAVGDILATIQRVGFKAPAGENTAEDEYKEVYATILNHSLHLAGASTGGLLFLTPDRANLRLVAAVNLEDPSLVGKLIPRGNGVTWMCLESDPPRIINAWDVQAPEYRARYVSFSGGPPVRSELAVPLVSKDGPLGVINIESEYLNAFGLEHERMLDLFAHQVALLISLIRLYGKWRGACALASYGDMSANVAHRMNNYIGGIRAVAQVMAQDESAGAELRDNAAKIVGASQDALRVLREFRDLFAQTITTVDLRGPVEAAANEFIARKSHQISVHLPPSPVLITAAQSLLTELCRELIRNATKYTPEGKAIEIRLDDQPWLAVLSVSDSGTGFPEDRVEQVFERGYRGTTSAPGTGYGLWWARQFIAMLGGKIEAVNGPEGGATVRVEIPK
jgi:signal transduction histidine kinase